MRWRTRNQRFNFPDYASRFIPIVRKHLFSRFTHQIEEIVETVILNNNTRILSFGKLHNDSVSCAAYPSNIVHYGTWDRRECKVDSGQVAS